MALFKVSGTYSVVKHVDRIVRADDEDDAKEKAWQEDYEDELERDEETLGEFNVDEVEEIEE